MRRRIACVAAGAMACVAVAASGACSKAEELTGPVMDRAFLFTGVDAGPNSGFVWAGLAAVPFGALLEDGLRVRAMGGAGRYKYETSAVAGGKNNGTITSGEFTVGYHKSFDATVVTAYVGIDAKNYRLQNPDSGNSETGSHVGVKAILELYTRTAPDWFVTAYGNVSSIFATYGARAAIHHEIAPGFALGAEGGVLGDARHNEQRAGAIATLSFAKASVSVAGGVAWSSDAGSGAYTTLTLYAPF